MPQTGITIADLERELVRRIEALDGSAYAQGSRVGVWRESKIPLSVVSEVQAIGHLAFNVFVEAGRNTGGDRDRAPDGYVKLGSDVAILFAYHLGPSPDRQIPDQRAASDAARDVLRAVLALPQRDFVSLPVSAWRPAVTTDGEWMLVRLDLLVLHDLPLS